MAAFTSKAAGNWSASGTTTWTQVGVPAANDTVTISHAIAVDVNTTIGLTAFTTGGTAAITMSGGSLTVNAGVTLTVSGDINHTGDSPVTLAAGSTVSFKPPSGQQCVWNQTTNTNSAITANGSSGSHATITTDKSLGGLSSYMTAGSFRNQGVITATFLDVSNMGDATHHGIISQVDFNNNANVSLTDCTFTGSNYFMTAPGGNAWDGNLTLQRITFTSSVGWTFSSVARCCHITFNANPTTGVRLVDSCSFDISPSWGTYGQCKCTNNVFAAGLFINAGTWVTSPADWSNNFLNLSADQISLRGPFQNCYIANPTASNPHFILMAVATSGIVSGLIFEATSASNDGAGDCLIPPSVTGTITVQNCLVLPTAANGKTAGKLISALQTGGAMGITCNHNTYAGFAGEAGLVHLGETAVSYAGELVSCQANLCWFSASTTNGYAIRDTTATPAVDAVTVAGYNAFFNPSTGTNKYNTSTSQGGVTGYSALTVSVNVPYPNATVGTGDITADPQFIDSTRALATWSTSQGGAGTVADAITRLQANPALVALAGTGLLAWVRAGWVPTNTALEGVSFPGDTSTTDAAGNTWAGGLPGIGALSVPAPLPQQVGPPKPLNLTSKPVAAGWV